MLAYTASAGQFVDRVHEKFSGESDELEHIVSFGSKHRCGTAALTTVTTPSKHIVVVRLMAGCTVSSSSLVRTDSMSEIGNSGIPFSVTTGTEGASSSARETGESVLPSLQA